MAKMIRAVHRHPGQAAPAQMSMPGPTVKPGVDRAQLSPGEGTMKIEIEREPGPEMMTVQEAAALMRVGRDTAYSLVAERRIPSLRLGRQIRIPRQALLDHLAKTAIEHCDPRSTQGKARQ
jgi:excisionase family DNA binding protein